MKDLILWFTGISITIGCASIISSILLYFKYRCSWMLYYLLYAGIVIVTCVLHQFSYFYTILVPKYFFIESVLPYVYFVFILVQGIVVPFFLLTLIENKVTFFKKIIIFFNVILLCAVNVAYTIVYFILGTDHILTIIFYYCVTVSYYFYSFVFIFFIIYSLVKWKHITAKHSKRGMIFYLLSTALYIPTVFLSRIVPIPDDIQFIGYIYFPLYVFIWFASVLFVNLRVMNSKSGISNTALPEPFINEYSITRREAEIILCLLDGLSSKNIADSLFISVKTVNTHIYNIFSKCHISNRMQLASIIRRYN